MEVKKKKKSLNSIWEKCSKSYCIRRKTPGYVGISTHKNARHACKYRCYTYRVAQRAMCWMQCPRGFWEQAQMVPLSICSFKQFVSLKWWNTYIFLFNLTFGFCKNMCIHLFKTSVNIKKCSFLHIRSGVLISSYLFSLLIYYIHTYHYLHQVCRATHKCVLFHKWHDSFSLNVFILFLLCTFVAMPDYCV